LSPGNTYKVEPATPPYLEANYDGYSITVTAYLDGQEIDWDKVEDIDVGKGPSFIIEMADGNSITINADDLDDYPRNNWPDDIRLYNERDEIIWEYIY